MFTAKNPGNNRIIELITNNCTPLSILQSIITPETAKLHKQGYTGLHACALSFTDQRERFKLFLNHGANINSQVKDPNNIYWNTPLHIAIANELFNNFIILIEEANLAKKTIDYDIQDREGKTPLILASKMARHDMACELLIQKSKGAKLDVNMMDNEGNTALHYACALGQLNTVRELLKSGGNSNLRNKADKTPLDMIKLNKEGLESILKSVDVDPQRDEIAKGNTFSDGFTNIIYVLADNGIKLVKIPSERKNIGALQNCLTLPVIDKRGGILELKTKTMSEAQKQALLKQAESYTGRSLLLNCIEGQPKVEKFLTDYLIQGPEFYNAFPNLDKMVVIIQGCSAAIDYIDPMTQQSTLHLAAKAGNLPVCQFLLRNGTNINLADKKRNTALHVACQALNLEIIEVLLTAGADTKLTDEDKSTPVQVILRQKPTFFKDETTSKIRELFGFQKSSRATEVTSIARP